MFTTAKAAETDDEKTAISDLKSTDISVPRLIGDENADTALVKYCINNGTVDGTESTGGVAGCVGFGVDSSFRRKLFALTALK